MSNPATTGARPTRPGFYWAQWTDAAPGTYEGKDLTPSEKWEVVEVWENFVGDPCEADECEKFGVFVPGVRETQWLDNFIWGERVEMGMPKAIAELEEKYRKLIDFMNGVRDAARSRNPDGATILDFMACWNEQYERRIGELEASLGNKK